MRRFAWGLVFCLFLVGVLYVGKPLIMPFVLAVALWYLINILTDAFAKPVPKVGLKMPRPIAFCAALVTIMGAVYFAAWIIVTNISGVAAAIPAYQYNFDQMSRRILALIPWGEPLTVSKLMADIDFGSITRVVVVEVTNIFGISAIVAVYLLFLFLEQGSFKGKLKKLIPDTVDNGHDVGTLIARIGYDIRMYLGIKTVASLTTAILSYIIFKSVGLNFASFWAFLIFLFNFIPTIGSIASTILPSFFAFMQYESLGPFLVVIIGVAALQMLIGNILEPRFQGDRLNLSPLVILLSLALWNMVWGIPGMFLCVPLTSITMIIFSHFPQTRKIAIALSRSGSISAGADEDNIEQVNNKKKET